MKYAVVQAGGKQYKVSEGDVIAVERMQNDAGHEFNFDKVLMYAADGAFQLGQPTLPSVTITGKIVEHFKGRKIRVAKYKAKARIRTVSGHRQLLTKVQIEKIAAEENKKRAPKEDKTVSK